MKNVWNDTYYGLLKTCLQGCQNTATLYGGRPPRSAGPEGEVPPRIERRAHQQRGPGAPAVVLRRGIVQQAAHDAQVSACATTHVL